MQIVEDDLISCLRTVEKGAGVGGERIVLA